MLYRNMIAARLRARPYLQRQEHFAVCSIGYRGRLAALSERSKGAEKNILARRQSKS
jgi:hypothetical protein